MQKDTKKFDRQDFMLDFVLNQLNEDQETSILNSLNQQNQEHGALVITFNKNNQNFVNSNQTNLQVDGKKIINHFPESLSRYMIKSFQKCANLEERKFMENTMLEIMDRCKHRGILFTRDWDAVTQPSLERESKSYLLINKQIMDGD